jgi:beta-lactamase superfamily II metal-dependent hydrolase
MAGVLRTFVVRRYIDNAMVQTTRTYESIVSELQRKHIEVLKPTARQIGIGGGATLRILPSPSDANTQNNRSVGVMLDYLNFRALFTGDAEDHERAFWRDSAGLRAVDVLKVAHHGSINGTDSAFLKVARPCIGIISVATKNSFGHPSPDVLRLLASSGVQVHRTDREGEITMTVVAGRLQALATTRGAAPSLPKCTAR